MAANHVNVSFQIISIKGLAANHLKNLLYH